MSRVGAFSALLLVIAFVASAARGSTGADDFRPRFITACLKRGLTADRCTCMSGIVMREVADEHLALMLDYFENPEGPDSRAMQELDRDQTRLRELEDEIVAAQSRAKVKCSL